MLLVTSNTKGLNGAREEGYLMLGEGEEGNGD